MDDAVEEGMEGTHPTWKQEQGKTRSDAGKGLTHFHPLILEGHSGGGPGGLPPENRTPNHQVKGMMAWWMTWRKVIWLFFFRRMKKTWGEGGQIAFIWSEWTMQFI